MLRLKKSVFFVATARNGLQMTRQLRHTPVTTTVGVVSYYAPPQVVSTW